MRFAHSSLLVFIGASRILSASSVCNFGAWFDKNMSMNAHVGKVCSKAFLGLNKIEANKENYIGRCYQNVGSCIHHVSRLVLKLLALPRVTVPTQPITTCP